EQEETVMLTQVQFGDSPAVIARRFGVSMPALIAANPHKATTVVAGVQTWRDLTPGETIVVPVAGLVGDAATDAVNALVAPGLNPSHPPHAPLPFPPPPVLPPP